MPDGFSGFFEAVPHALIVSDSAGTIERANGAAEKLFGYEPGEMIGRSIEDLMPEGVRRGHSAMRATFQAEARSRMMGEVRDLQALRKDGTTISVSIGLAPWKGSPGNRVISCVTDTEARRRAEREAQERREAASEAGDLSRTIIRDAPMGILMYEVDSGQCVSANRAAATITELTPEELQGQNFRTIPTWRDSGLLDSAEEVIATRTPTVRDVEMVTTTGKPVALSCSFLVIAWDHKPHLVLMMNDQTARRNLEEQVRVAQKMEAIGQLAGGVAHDFNNLLTVIGTYSSLMIEEFPPGDSRRDDLEEIYSAAKRAATLTRQLLAFGRRQLLDARLLNVNDVVGSLEKMLRRVLSAEISLDLRLDPDLGTIHADAGQMEQVIMNLVVNARDAMPDGGRITIETANIALPPDPDAGSGRPGSGRRLASRHKVMIRVTDTGIGMDDETAARIFEPFFTTKPAGKGTGLGLATTYGIVRQSGGTINVRSQPGQGAAFELTFRRMSGPAEDAGPEQLAATDSGGSGEVLVVEDDDHVRRIVIDTLTQRGYRVTSATNGREALAIAEARETPPDLVVTDVIMPELNGRDLVANLRARWPNLRVLFTTAYAVDEVTGAVAQDLPGRLLRKPFVPNELGAAVREALK